MDYSKQCGWPYPNLPFWASIDEGREHANWTHATDGRRCPTREDANVPYAL
jgi:hypothetical protein